MCFKGCGLCQISYTCKHSPGWKPASTKRILLSKGNEPSTRCRVLLERPKRILECQQCPKLSHKLAIAAASRMLACSRNFRMSGGAPHCPSEVRRLHSKVSLSVSSCSRPGMTRLQWSDRYLGKQRELDCPPAANMTSMLPSSRYVLFDDLQPLMCVTAFALESADQHTVLCQGQPIQAM